ncbi:MAG: hypothetical protein M1440_12885 [Gammaproteobacteria bacterium]|nr:hypothetical protein [Gammaproteobacteria bacterium]
MHLASNTPLQLILRRGESSTVISMRAAQLNLSTVKAGMYLHLPAATVLLRQRNRFWKSQHQRKTHRVCSTPVTSIIALRIIQHTLHQIAGSSIPYPLLTRLLFQPLLLGSQAGRFGTPLALGLINFRLPRADIQLLFGR